MTDLARAAAEAIGWWDIHADEDPFDPRPIKARYLMGNLPQYLAEAPGKRSIPFSLRRMSLPEYETKWHEIWHLFEFAQIQGYRVALFEERTGGDDATIADPKWTVELRPRHEETVIVRESDVHPLPAMCRAVVALGKAIRS